MTAPIPVLPAGYRLVAHDSLDSTNDEARRMAADGAASGTIVWARSQTAGRGRRGRRWDSPAGNLYCSLILRPAEVPAVAAQLTFVAVLALGDAVAAILPERVEIRYKWPNDLLLDGAKAAGILLESAGVSGKGVDWLVLGCGLNIATFPAETPDYPATSLRQAGAAGASVEAMLEGFIDRFDFWQARWRARGLDAVREAWLGRAARVGEKIVVRLPGDRLEGRFAGLDDTGALILELADGGRRTITAGDVFP